MRRGDTIRDPFLHDVLGEIGTLGSDYLVSFEQAFSKHLSSVSEHAKNTEIDYFTGRQDQSVVRSAQLFKAKTQALYNKQTKDRKTNHAVKRDGLILLAGTDAQNFGVVFGYAMHQELEALVDNVGFSTWEALEAATILPGEFLNKRYGTGEGDIANLLILTEDPIKDIHNLKKIDQVILRGKPVYPVSLISAQPV